MTSTTRRAGVTLHSARPLPDALGRRIRSGPSVSLYEAYTELTLARIVRGGIHLTNLDPLVWDLPALDRFPTQVATHLVVHGPRPLAIVELAEPVTLTSERPARIGPGRLVVAVPVYPPNPDILPPTPPTALTVD